MSTAQDREQQALIRAALAHVRAQGGSWRNGHRLPRLSRDLEPETADQRF
jgi:hypothetical protein